MFVRKPQQLPHDPYYPPVLTELEKPMRVNEQGQFVQIENPNAFFEYHITNNERVNEVHREAMHAAARKVVVEELKEFGVFETYLTGTYGDEIRVAKPEAPHVKILMSNREELFLKKDVVVVIGEHNQDVGIWAWRHVLREGGIDGGTAVGLMKKIHGITRDQTKRSAMRDEEGSDVEPTFPFAIKSRNDSVIDTKSDRFPGIVILNPGQLIYSPKNNETMTQVSWHARQRDTPLSPPTAIHPKLNRVPGHTTPEEHIRTIFLRIFDSAILQDARLYIVGITDGSEKFVRFMDNLLIQQDDHPLLPKIKGMAFMEPMHDVEGIQTEALEESMLHNAKSWILSSMPKGRFINAPGATKPFSPRPETPEGQFPGAEAKKWLAENYAEPLGRTKPVLIAKSGNEIAVEEMHDEAAEVAKHDEVIAGSLPEEVPIPDKRGDKPPQLPPLAKSIANIDLNEGPGKTPAPTPTTPTHASRTFDKRSPSSEAPGLDEDDEDHFVTSCTEAGEYDYATTFVSCPTYSAGVNEYHEMIFPNVLDEVLDHFKAKYLKAQRLEEQMEKLNEIQAEEAHRERERQEAVERMYQREDDEFDSEETASDHEDGDGLFFDQKSQPVHRTRSL